MLRDMRARVLLVGLLLVACWTDDSIPFPGGSDG